MQQYAGLEEKKPGLEDLKNGLSVSCSEKELPQFEGERLKVL